MSNKNHEVFVKNSRTENINTCFPNFIPVVNIGIQNLNHSEKFQYSQLL
jgi:hypothetical protein